MNEILNRILIQHFLRFKQNDESLGYGVHKNRKKPGW